jgi:hypothetical protein
MNLCRQVTYSSSNTIYLRSFTVQGMGPGIDDEPAISVEENSATRQKLLPPKTIQVTVYY